MFMFCKCGKDKDEGGCRNCFKRVLLIWLYLCSIGIYVGVVYHLALLENLVPFLVVLVLGGLSLIISGTFQALLFNLHSIYQEGQRIRPEVSVAGNGLRGPWF